VERREIEPPRLADGANDGIEAFVGPDRRPFVWNAGKFEHQSFERRFFVCESGFECRSLGAGVLRPPTEFSSLFRCCILELRADCIALGPEPIDVGLAGADLGIERKQLPDIEIDALLADRALNRLA